MNPKLAKGDANFRPKPSFTEPWTVHPASRSETLSPAILITSINIIAGFLIGVLQHGMELQRALQTYTILTIGDGLVTVIPALMISVSGGLIVTRASSEQRLGTEFASRFSVIRIRFCWRAEFLACSRYFPDCRRFRFWLWAAVSEPWLGE